MHCLSLSNLEHSMLKILEEEDFCLRFLIIFNFSLINLYF